MERHPSEDDFEIGHQLARWVLKALPEQDAQSCAVRYIEYESLKTFTISAPTSLCRFRRPLEKTLAVQDPSTVLCVRPYSAICPSFPGESGQIRETRSVYGPLCYRWRRVCATAGVLTRIAQLQPWVRVAALARSLALAVPPKTRGWLPMPTPRIEPVCCATGSHRATVWQQEWSSTRATEKRSNNNSQHRTTKTQEFVFFPR